MTASTTQNFAAEQTCLASFRPESHIEQMSADDVVVVAAVCGACAAADAVVVEDFVVVALST